MAKNLVYADFHNLDDEGRVCLNCAGTHQDLERHGIELREGMTLSLYTDDADDNGQSDNLLADGVVHFDESGKCWVAVIDWTALRHASEIRDINGATTPQSRATKPTE